MTRRIAVIDLRNAVRAGGTPTVCTTMDNAALPNEGPDRPTRTCAAVRERSVRGRRKPCPVWHGHFWLVNLAMRRPKRH
jgi:hypothetical protein